MDNMQQSYIQESGQPPTVGQSHAGAKHPNGLLTVAFILQIMHLLLFVTLLVSQKFIINLVSFSYYEEYVMVWPMLDIVIVIMQTFVVGLFFVLLPNATQMGNRNVFMAAMLVCGILIVVPFSGISGTISTILYGHGGVNMLVSYSSLHRFLSMIMPIGNAALFFTGLDAAICWGHIRQ